ncbi:hypothetical protein [Xenorhabdus hominickii]|uniref:Uncharacterized protein n=1 Tax=Xenorhabdus hominickii TaxID=351679 RepID=A0A2G0Q622_XENHO|nr:hypothetical protein [Xenorhabdus hominickii]PHM54653.1 hypothetical protein Xhom_02603 [Xenorhabdus hominickii]
MLLQKGQVITVTGKASLAGLSVGCQFYRLIGSDEWRRNPLRSER